VIKNQLLNVLNQKKSFNNFKNTLLDFPEIREQWFKYQDERIKEAARELLGSYQIDAELL